MVCIDNVVFYTNLEPTHDHVFHKKKSHVLEQSGIMALLEATFILMIALVRTNAYDLYDSIRDDEKAM